MKIKELKLGDTFRLTNENPPSALFLILANNQQLDMLKLTVCDADFDKGQDIERLGNISEALISGGAVMLAKSFMAALDSDNPLLRIMSFMRPPLPDTPG